MRLLRLLPAVVVPAAVASCASDQRSAAGAASSRPDPAGFRGSGFAPCPAPSGAAVPASGRTVRHVYGGVPLAYPALRAVVAKHLAVAL